MRVEFLLTALYLCAAVPVSAEENPDKSDTTSTAAQLEFFEKQVRPILTERCHKCHGPKKQEGGLRLDSRAAALKGGDGGAVIEPGQPEKSELLAAINYGADSYQMPPDGKLPPEQIAALTQWVKLGAPWPKSQDAGPREAGESGIDLVARARHWSFHPVAAAKVPTMDDGGWARNPIDRFILARMQQSDLRPASPADKRTLLRRLSYDLTGLPPTLDELHDFLADNSPTAYEDAVERLLASPRYGERWARHWLDLVRFAETGGHEFDYDIPHAWPYRDYVIRAFNQDVPYNRLVVEHIAGDLVDRPRRRVANGDNESVIGTAFYWFGQGKHSPVDIRAEECDNVDNQLDVLGKTFLGLTIACARCHDHKFDPIRARDYYALAGFLQSSRRQLAILNDPEETLEMVRSIADLKSKTRNLVIQGESQGLTAALDRLVGLMQDDSAFPAAQREAWRHEHEKAARENPAHLLHPWTVLRGKTTADEFSAARAALLGRLRDQARASQDGVVDFSDFSDATFNDWFVGGPAFGTGPSRAGDLVWHEQETSPPSIVAEMLPAGLAHSGLISGRLEGTLRSPTFTIEKRYVWYRVRRVGGRPNPGRPLKNGQLHLIVDGFQYGKDPLYGGLSINVPNDGKWRWLGHDVGKFSGSRGYLEIEDDDDGAIVVDRVVFADGGHPADRPNPLIVALLDNADLTTTDQLAGRYRQLFRDSLQKWVAGEITKADDGDDRAAVIGWLVENRRLFAGDAQPHDATKKAANAASRYRDVARSIQPPHRSVAMTEGTPENEHVLVRGNHKKPGEAVKRRFLEVLAGPAPPEPESGSGRLRLAREIVDPANPLTARVMVNRLWLHHFGRGIVASPDNFGVQGEKPSHPELLDWLAREFVESGWSIKHMHRLMLQSSVYRMSSRADNAEAERIDPENMLLHRMNVQRLEGEAIRDGLLVISGEMVDRHYGPGVLPHLTPFMEGRGRPGSGPLDGEGRRSIYINVRRNFLTPLFLAFDLPLPSTTIGKRSVSNVPAQALTMMNNPFVIQQSRLWADRVLKEIEASGGRQSTDSRDEIRTARIQRLYETAFSREPTEAELTAAAGFLTEQGKEYNGADDPRTWADLCHVLLNVKEFVFVN